ncbi:hypothetical protein EVAR_52124_1 [Eumeta japonica]|uniref:Uncharacterized protein n=1 Tax=Eumeta variegata TaxID=151549 RepID=A0A4C1XQB0_EUMVA|nr:hypothetical protein EVAR_52124_1 [Eumeta japonica]
MGGSDHLLALMVLMMNLIALLLICLSNLLLKKNGCCVRPLSLFYSDASADGVEERSLVLRSRSHARLRRNATMSHAL